GTNALVDPLLDTQVLVGGVHLGHVGAEGLVGECQRGCQSEQLEYAGEYGTHLLSQNLSGKIRARTRQPSRETATTRPTMFSAVTASSPPWLREPRVRNPRS